MIYINNITKELIISDKDIQNFKLWDIQIGDKCRFNDILDDIFISFTYDCTMNDENLYMYRSENSHIIALDDGTISEPTNMFYSIKKIKG